MITSIVLAWITGFFVQFWGWIAAGCVAILTLLFSPTLRKYTIGVIAASILLIMAFVYGYNSNDTVTTVTHSCSDFRKVLVTGPATDKVIGIFIRKGLCENA